MTIVSRPRYFTSISSRSGVDSWPAGGDPPVVAPKCSYSEIVMHLYIEVFGAKMRDNFTHLNTEVVKSVPVCRVCATFDPGKSLPHIYLNTTTHKHILNRDRYSRELFLKVL